jgi:tetratricopeptide (TPR) repeat protein
MSEDQLLSIANGLIAAGIGGTAKTTTREVYQLLQDRCRDQRISESLGDIATEFQTALKETIEEENDLLASNELTEVTVDWPDIAERLAATEAAPDTDSRLSHEEIDFLFADEQEAIERLTEAIAAINGFDIEQTPQLRRAMETALTRAYRRAIIKFEQRIAGTDLAEIFLAEIGLDLSKQLDALTGQLDDRLETLESSVERILTQAIRNEGFSHLSPYYFERVEPSPVACWRTTFSLADVHANIPARRGGHETGTTATNELVTALRDSKNRLVVGRPGAGKSTLCKQVALQWYHDENTGSVLYRESGSGGQQFESTAALGDAIEQAEGHVLVVVEDAVRVAAQAISSVMEDFSAHSDVSFLLDTRQVDLDRVKNATSTNPTERRHRDLISNVHQYRLPMISIEDLIGVLEAFESATGRTVGQDPDALHAEITGEGTGEFGPFLLLSYHLPADRDTVEREESKTAIESHVDSRYETIADPESDETGRKLSQFDPDLLSDIGVMVNLLNAAGLGIHQELIHALGHEYGHNVNTHDEIETILHALEGWFLFPTGEETGGPDWTIHELWSTLYLRRLAREHSQQQASSRRRDQSEPDVGQCLEALFVIFDDETQPEALDKQFPDSQLLASIAATQQETAAAYIKSIFELGERWPVLASLFGTAETARYTLPETIPETIRQWVLNARGNVHRKRGAYTKAHAEYEQTLRQTQETGDRAGEAGSLNNLGLIARSQGDYEDAQDYFQDSLDIQRDISNRAGEADSLTNLGVVAHEQGNYEAAQDYSQCSLDIKRDLDDRVGGAISLTNLGLVAYSRGDYEDAQDYFQDSLDIQRDFDDRVGEADSLNNLGLVAHEQGNYEAARDYHQRSLDIKRDIGNRASEAGSLNNLGIVAGSQGDYEDAQDYFQDSLDIQRDIGNRAGEADSLTNLGAVAREQNDYEAVYTWWESARDLYGQIGIVWKEIELRQNLIQLEIGNENEHRAQERCKAAIERLDGLGNDFSDLREQVESICEGLRNE